MGSVSGRERCNGEGSEEDEPRGEEAEGRQEQGYVPGGGNRGERDGEAEGRGAAGRGEAQVAGGAPGARGVGARRFGGVGLGLRCLGRSEARDRTAAVRPGSVRRSPEPCTPLAGTDASACVRVASGPATGTLRRCKLSLTRSMLKKRWPHARRRPLTCPFVCPRSAARSRVFRCNACRLSAAFSAREVATGADHRNRRTGR